MPFRIYVRREAPGDGELSAEYWHNVDYCSLPVSPHDTEGTDTLHSFVQHVLCERLPELASCAASLRNEKVVVQGTRPQWETPLDWLLTTMVGPDSFLHMCILLK